jgi:hypothetical protein
MDKQHILNEIRRTATANGGLPPGRIRFFNETGIRETDWLKFWPRWSAAVEEAGFTPLKFQGKNDRLIALRKLAELTRKLGAFPTRWELELTRREDSQFPNPSSLLRRTENGGKDGLIEELAEYCSAEVGYEDVVQILGSEKRPEKKKALPEEEKSKVQYADVYLLRSGNRFKIGFSIAALSRATAINTSSPEGVQVVHIIRTDDPRGIEAYWHNRFAEKRGNGEWFALSAADVAAFKRRKFM